MAMFSSLTNRIFLSSTLLATVSIGFAVYFVSSRLRSEAEAELQRDLRDAVMLVEEQRTALFDTFTRTARFIADLPRLKAALETRDAPTVAPIAADYQQQSGSDLLLLTDPDGHTLAALGGIPGPIERIADAPAVSRARRGAASAAFWPHPKGVLQVVSVPVTIGIERPELLGTLTLGYLLDNDRAASFKAVTGADVAFAIDGQIRASTLAAEASPRLASLLGTELVPRAMIGASEYAALVRALHAPKEADSGGSAVPIAVVLRSRTERMRTLSAIQTGLGLAALATIVLAAALSYGVARTVTRPLATITAHMRDIASTGDLTRKLRLGDSTWHDEDARLLASTFNTLTDSIARFQREASQRERLSSLGRMSTIIAHEIRNPLMIVKGALRQLTRDGATPADIREAAADINGETERLNRIVNEVLDFARPIRFERSPTDINALCRDAVSAVAAAGGTEPRVTVELDPSLPPLDTDSERLRTALVNLLTNARQAVLARPHEDAIDATDGTVIVSTGRLAEHRVTISIRDYGIGIGAEELPRVFDPFFTTRRNGTGLGLPIAKNIIDALGGTITVASTPGAGTRIRIELGDAPVPRPS
jgi:signal transduction histidine kinase